MPGMCFYFHLILQVFAQLILSKQSGQILRMEDIII